MTLKRTYYQYWYELSSSQQETYDKVWDWIGAQHKFKPKMKDTEKPTHMNVSAGKGLSKTIEGERKHFLINIFDNSDKSFSDLGWCEQNSKTLMRIQVYPEGRSRLTEKARQKIKNIWDDKYFPDLWKLLGGQACSHGGNLPNVTDDEKLEGILKIRKAKVFK